MVLVGPVSLARQLAGTDPAAFAVGLGSVVVALVCWSGATRQPFRSAGTPLSRRQAFVAYGAGAFGKQVLPTGNADAPAVMAHAFDRESGAGYARSLGVVVVAESLSLVASLVLAGVDVVLFRLCTFWFFVLVTGVARSTATGRVRDLPPADGAPTVDDGGTRADPPDPRS